jgi:hypothetical protein
MRSFLLLVLLATPVLATPANATDVIRLSDAQREAVIAAAANGPEKEPVLTPEQVARPSLLDRPLYPEFWGEGAAAVDRKVHGQATMFAGSGGTFGMSGTAVMPVGNTGTAAISVMQGTSRWGGLQGFSLGYASDGAMLGGGFSSAFGGGFGSFASPLPWGYGANARPRPGRRIR